MTDLTFMPIEEGHLDLLTSWFEDPDTRRWVELPTPHWFRYVHAGVESRAWIACDAGQPVGLVQFDVMPDKTGYFSVVTNPALRKRGYGKRMLETLVKMQDPKVVSRIAGTVEPDNTASIRCMLSAGFVQDGDKPDDEGFLCFSYHLAAPA